MFSGSLVAIATPMRPDGAVDFGAWERLLDFHAASGTSGIVVVATGLWFTDQLPTPRIGRIKALPSC